MPGLPHLILLNGTSSSGKTAIARALQEGLPAVFLNFSIDCVLYALPPSDFAAMIEGRPIARSGYRYTDLVLGFHAALAGLLSTGNRLVVDNAMTRADWRGDFDRATAPFDVVRVGVVCDLAVARAREEARRDRAPGTAEREFPLVHAGMNYNLTVDTSAATAAEVAAEIIGFLKTRG